MHALSVSHVVYDDVCTRDLCQWVLFQLEQDKNSPRPFSPEKFEFSMSGSELTGKQRWQSDYRVGSVPRPRPRPLPVSPAPAFLLLSRDRHRYLQRPDEERS